MKKFAIWHYQACLDRSSPTVRFSGAAHVRSGIVGSSHIVMVDGPLCVVQTSCSPSVNIISSTSPDVHSAYSTGYPMNKSSTPIVIQASPPRFTHPLLLNTSEHCILSRSFGSGVCIQSSFSISSGNSNSPAEGIILYFSLTVCELIAGGAREASSSIAPSSELRRDEFEDHDACLPPSSATGVERTDLVSDLTLSVSPLRLKFLRLSFCGGKRYSDNCAGL